MGVREVKDIDSLTGAYDERDGHYDSCRIA